MSAQTMLQQAGEVEHAHPQASLSRMAAILMSTPSRRTDLAAVTALGAATKQAAATDLAAETDLAAVTDVVTPDLTAVTVTVQGVLTKDRQGVLKTSIQFALLQIQQDQPHPMLRTPLCSSC
jgi:hypothetical protein